MRLEYSRVMRGNPGPLVAFAIEEGREIPG